MKIKIQIQINKLRKTIEEILLKAPSFDDDLKLARELGEQIADLQSLVDEMKD